MKNVVRAGIIKTGIISIIMILIIIFICLVILMDIFLIYPPSKDYVSETFSVVVNNTTDHTISDINILYGGSYDVDTGDTPEAVLYENIECIEPGQYIKVIIPTDNPSEMAGLPYNVYVTMLYDGDKITAPVGYFGVRTGGFAVIEIKELNNKLELNQLSKSSRKYHRLYWKHRRHQWELSW